MVHNLDYWKCQLRRSMFDLHYIQLYTQTALNIQTFSIMLKCVRTWYCVLVKCLMWIYSILHTPNINYTAISGSKSRHSTFHTFLTISYFFNNLGMRHRSCRYETVNIIEIVHDSDVHLMFALLKFIELVFIIQVIVIFMYS